MRIDILILIYVLPPTLGIVNQKAPTAPGGSKWERNIPPDRVYLLDNFILMSS